MSVFDPGWDMPQENWLQQGSYESGEIPPAVSPDAGTPICIGPVAQEWLPLILGALDQLRNPSAWIVADDAAMYQTLGRVDLLREIIATSLGCEVPVQTRLQNCILQTSADGGATWADVPGWTANFANCVRDLLPPPPPVIGPGPIEQHACNLAGFMASELIQSALAKAVAEYGATVTYIDFALWVGQNTFASALPYSYAFAQAVFEAWQVLSAGNIADFRAAVTDPVLLAKVTCAIFNAIRLDGQITDANWPTVVANVCAVSYLPAEIIPVICSIATTMGAVNARGLQVVGAYETGDCSNCGTWCYKFDFTVSDGGWITNPAGFTVRGSWVGGVGWQSGIEVLSCPGDPFNNIQIVSPFFADTTITWVEFGVTSPVAAGVNSCWGTIRRIGLYLDGGVAGQFDQSGGILPHCYADGGAIAPTVADRVFINYLTEGVGPPDQICSCTLKGIGVNPFGATNCV